MDSFKNSIGKELMFETVHTLDGKPVYKEVFKGLVDKVENDHILVKYICVSVDNDFKVTTETQLRKLVKGEFKLLSTLTH